MLNASAFGGRGTSLPTPTPYTQQASRSWLLNRLLLCSQTNVTPLSKILLATSAKLDGMTTLWMNHHSLFTTYSMYFYSWGLIYFLNCQWSCYSLYWRLKHTRFCFWDIYSFCHVPTFHDLFPTYDPPWLYHEEASSHKTSTVAASILIVVLTLLFRTCYNQSYYYYIYKTLLVVEYGSSCDINLKHKSII